MTHDTTISLGTIAELYRYPVKSMQGLGVDSLNLQLRGAEGDRCRALIDRTTGKLMSAKRWSKLLFALADDVGITLPDGTQRAYDADDLDTVLSNWMGREVQLREVDPEEQLAFEMTLDPPNDEAELFDIPAAPGSFLDLAPVHLVSRQTLRGSGTERPDLNWDVRRFRPNLVVDGPGLSSFGEDAWCGSQLRIGSAGLEALQPTVRCAMPLRGQPGLESQPGLFKALDGIHANHLGIYMTVIAPGSIGLGDQVEILS
ncbi:MAG: MOSC domain-containing protein [Acidimicrobiales bacterium]